MTRNLFIAMFVLTALVLPLAGCGESEGAISEETHGQIENGMTMDDVDALAGQPERSHSIGSAASPQVFWYYNKTEGEGFVRVVFENGQVTTKSPYDESITPTE